MDKPSTKSAISSRAQRKLDDLKKFAQDLQTSVNKVLPTGPAHYGHVAVLGMTWSNDTMGCKAAEDNLFNVLRKNYNYTCESYLLNAASSSPQRDLFHTITNFQKKHDSPDALLIYVYSGHGSSSWGGELDWAGQLDQQGNLKSPIIKWTQVQALPACGDGRVLLLFDTCYAGAGGLHNGPELFAAAGWGSQASRSRKYSFTKILTDHLTSLNGKPQTVSQISSQISRTVHVSKLPEQPVHFLEAEKESIVLERTPTASHAFGTGSRQARDAALRELGPNDFKVLISVNLVGDIIPSDLETWDKWLKTNLPRMVDRIEISAVYKTTSAVVHVAMPYEVWDGLPPDQEAYNFLGFVRSGNMLPVLRQPVFAERPKKENLPFAGSSREGSKR